MDAERRGETVGGKLELEGQAADRCPHLHEVAAGGMYGELAYCFGLPGGRLMVPSRDEFGRFCTNAHHVDCPIFRTNQAVHSAGNSVR